MSAALQTPRLVLEPLAQQHAQDLFRVFSSVTTLRYWHHPPHTTVEQTAAMIRDTAASPACQWAIILRETSRAIGTTGYLGTPVPGIGYILHQDYWRQGYGTEAANAALEYGFTHLNLNRVELWIDADNVASQRLAQKLGFVQRGQFYGRSPFARVPRETRVFGLRADEWAAQRQHEAPAAERTIPFLAVHPTLPVLNVQDSIAFYRDRLGFAPQYVSGDPPDFAIMARGEWSTEQAHVQLRHSGDVQPQHLFVMIGGYIDRLHEEYRQNDVMITRVPTTQPWGIRDFSIIDNNGHQITFGSVA